PALLGLIGVRVLNPRARNRIGGAKHVAPGRARMRTGSALATIAVATLALLAVAVPALSMRLGLPVGTSEAQDSTPYRTAVTVAEEFGDGQNGTLLVVAKPWTPIDEDDVLAEQVAIAGALMDEADVVAVAPVGVSD